VLRRRPQGPITADDVELVEAAVPALADGEVLVRNTWLSIDPTNRIWLSDVEQYGSPIPIGEALVGLTIGRVVESRSPQFDAGDLVRVMLGGWEEYSVRAASGLRRLKPLDGIPDTVYLSVLSIAGLTAYFGLRDVCRVGAGDTVVISAAAGSVGSLAGQIAKLMGCRVIGIAGGAGKCRFITEELGFDAAIDYKREDVGAALAQLCPQGVDADFENVGGAILDAVLDHMKVHGRVAVCGLISGYNRPESVPGPANFLRILMRRLTIEGFVIADFVSRYREGNEALLAWIQAGQLKWREHVYDGIESAPRALQEMFTASHIGKVLVRL